jgi:hypothetical protein
MCEPDDRELLIEITMRSAFGAGVDDLGRGPLCLGASPRRLPAV